MKVLVCGSCMPQQFEYKIKDLAAASNQYHLNMIKALKNFADVKVLSYIGMDLNGIHEDEIEGKCKKVGIECVFKKGNPIRAFFEYQRKLKKLSLWADIIITYNVQYVWFGVGKWARRNGKKSVLVWADHTPISDRKNIIGKLYAYLSEVNVREYQKVVALSPNMKSYISPSQEYTVSHGCVDYNQFEDFYYKKPGEYIILMFSGLLAPVTGADLLYEAIKKIQRNDIRIVVTGKGSLENIFKNLRDERLDFRGFVTREEYRELLQEADVLINPRNMNLAENQNNFPSKILEYLATGKFIISTRYSGWKDYEGLCQFIDSTSDIIAAAIDQVKKEDISEEIYKRNRAKASAHTWDNEIRRFV